MSRVVFAVPGLTLRAWTMNATTAARQRPNAPSNQSTASWAEEKSGRVAVTCSSSFKCQLDRSERLGH